MRIEELANREIAKRQSQSDENRSRFPQAAAFKDSCERVFGKCRLIRAGNETGEIGEGLDAWVFVEWPDFGKYGDAGVQVQNVSALKNGKRT